MKHRIVMAHPSGNSNVRQAALAFADAGVLAEFWTGISWDKGHWLNRFLPKKIIRQLSRRTFPEGIEKFIRTYPWHEGTRLLASRLLERHWIANEHGLLSSNACHMSLDKRVAAQMRRLKSINTVYGYEHCSLESFREAKMRGGKCIYDLTSGYWRELKSIVSEEIEAFPEWRKTAPSIDFPESVFKRKDDEIEAADQIIVASTFTRNTLEKHLNLKKPVHVIPYGAPHSISTNCVVKHNKKLRILFVGALGLGKGIPYLLDALRPFGKAIDVTIIGSKRGECRPLDEALRKYKWIPSLPHAEVLTEMDRHDVFIFPSLFDGFGLVILEAMSRGLPVITTQNTGGPDVIEDGKEGFIVPIRSAEAISEKIQLLNSNRQLLFNMGLAAKEKADIYNWECYKSRLIDLIKCS